MKETVEQLISAGAIKTRVSELAGEIAKDYNGEPFVIISILKGGYVFTADLARELSGNAHIEGIDFLRAGSYGAQTASSGEVRIDLDIRMSVHGKHVLIIEDIVDTGNTLVFLRDYLLLKRTASVKICSLLDKPERRTAHNAKFDYLGFTIPDEFVVGYGLDFAQRYRELPYVGILHFEEEDDE
jgi:hypoxanthine phosphoribosyltransferase